MLYAGVSAFEYSSLDAAGQRVGASRRLVSLSNGKDNSCIGDSERAASSQLPILTDGGAIALLRILVTAAGTREGPDPQFAERPAVGS